MLARQGSDRDGQCVLLLVGQDDQRPHEVAPRTEKGEQSQGHENRRQHRHDDLQEDAALAGAVDARRLQQLIRNRKRILPHQEDAEDARCHGYQHARERVDQPDLLHHQEQREHRHLRGDDQCRQEQLEDAVAASEPKLGECVSGSRVEH